MLLIWHLLSKQLSRSGPLLQTPRRRSWRIPKIPAILGTWSERRSWSNSSCFPQFLTPGGLLDYAGLIPLTPIQVGAELKPLYSVIYPSYRRSPLPPPQGAPPSLSPTSVQNSLLFFFIYSCVCLCVCVSVCHDKLRIQWRQLCKMRLQTVVTGKTPTAAYNSRVRVPAARAWHKCQSQSLQAGVPSTEGKDC